MVEMLQVLHVFELGFCICAATGQQPPATSHQPPAGSDQVLFTIISVVWVGANTPDSNFEVPKTNFDFCFALGFVVLIITIEYHHLHL